MFYNFNIAFRNLRRNGLYSTICILGLAVSLAACAFILLWMQDEQSYDRFHKDAKQIYQVIAHFKGDGRNSSTDVAPGLFATAAKQDFPEVDMSCRVLPRGVKTLEAGDIKLSEKRMLYADTTFFSFFTFPLVSAAAPQAFQAAADVIISERLAAELFGEQNPVGKTILLNKKDYLSVTGVMKNMPGNTSLFSADMVCSFEALNPQDEMSEMYLSMLDSWGSCEFQTYLRLQPGSDVPGLAKAITDRQTSWQDTRSFTLQPLVDRHLYTFDGAPNSIMKTITILQWTVFAILCIACINYINLIMARASKRQQEMGLRKILGARRKHLFLQLMREACIMFLFALLIAVALNLILLPGYNYLSGKEFTFLQWSNTTVWKIYGAMLLAVALLAGVYPAWMLASFQPAKKVQKKRQGGLLRKLLVIVQFVSSVVLMLVTIGMFAQMNYIRTKDLGFDREYVFTCPMPASYDVAMNELRNNPAVHEISCSSEDIVNASNSHIVSNWQGRIGDKKFRHGRMWVDSTFFTTMRMTFVEGGGFSGSAEEQFVINETAVKAMGMEQPVVGKWMEASGGIRGTITGVLRDFNFKDLHKEIEPVVIRRSNNAERLYVRTSAKDASKAIAAVEKLWKQHNPQATFTYSFLDDTFNRMYQSDVRFGVLFGIFSLIAVFISCFGLFGLVTYTAEMKTKEIGIRKVLGATVSNIVNMLSKEFLLLMGIAMLIAFPLGYVWLDTMLQDYAYRIPVSWWIFALAALLTLILTLLTAGWKAWQAATANPVDAIKTE